MLDCTKNKVAALPSLTRETDPFEAEGLTVINPWLAQQFDLFRFALEWSVTGDHTMAIFDETRNANILNCQLSIGSRLVYPCFATRRQAYPYDIPRSRHSNRTFEEEKRIL